MFGIEALDVVIGLIFVYLLFSLYVTIVNEMLNSTFNIRGRELATTIAQLFNYDSSLLKKFYDKPEIKTLTEEAGFVLKVCNNLFYRGVTHKLNDKRLPDQIEPKKFVTAFQKTIPPVKKSHEELIELYDGAMFKASALYKRKLRRVLFGLGLLTAAIFNADSIEIFKTLKYNPEVRAKIVEQATNYVEKHESLPEELKMTESELKNLKTNLDSLRAQQLDQLTANLGIGWDFNDLEKNTEAKLSDYLSAMYNQFTWLGFLGWFITALAISLGAPFWFDLLKKVINMKNELSQKKKEPVG